MQYSNTDQADRKFFIALEPQNTNIPTLAINIIDPVIGGASNWELTISLDAALRVESTLQSGALSNFFWGQACMNSFLCKVYGVDSTNERPNIVKIFYSIVKNYPVGAFYVLFKQIVSNIKSPVRSFFCKNYEKKSFIIYTDRGGYVDGDFLSISSIVDFSEWYVDYRKKQLKLNL